MNNPETPEQLSSASIEVLKEWLRDNPQSIGRVCTRLAVEKVEILHGTDLKKSFEYAMVDEIGDVVIENYIGIQKALSAPAGEWPGDATVNPEQVSQEVNSIIARENNG